MASSMPIIFENICRACLKDRNKVREDVQHNFLSLFDYVDDDSNEKVQIFDLFNRVVNKLPQIDIINDELPKNICQRCFEKVCAFSEFQNCCLNSDVQLRKIISESLTMVGEKTEQSDPLHHDVLSIEKEIKQEDAEPKVMATIDLIVNRMKDDVDIPDSNCVDDGSAPSTEIWSCEKCNKHFKSEANLNHHLSNKHKPRDEILKTFECDKCDTVLKSKDNFKRHMRLHEQSGGNKISKDCELCDQSYRTLKKLLDHYMTVHPERLQSDELPVPEALKYVYCPYCKKGMKYVGDHLRTHTKERPFLCSHCGKGYSSSTSLKQHLLRHTDEKRYACKICPKRFTCLSDLCSHRHIHNQDKPHVCDICEKAFKKTHELTVHKRIHAARTYKCEQCGKDFVGAKHLNRHRLTHTGEKPYKCKYCTRSFSQSNDLMKHLRTHLGDNVYQCELCPAAFSKDGERRIHFSTHINDDEETRERNKRALFEAQEKLKLRFQLNK